MRWAYDPTLVMKLSDGAIIPANLDVDAFLGAAEFTRRLKDFYEPYHAAVASALARARAGGAVPAILSIHSFTPVWRGVARPWHRSEEHTSDLQSLMRISYAVFCLKKKIKTSSCYYIKHQTDIIVHHNTLDIKYIH